MSASTIQIPESTIHALDHLKIHPGESYAEVIDRLITLCCDEEELDPDEWSRIQRAEEEYRSGNVCSLEEIKRRLGDE